MTAYVNHQKPDANPISAVFLDIKSIIIIKQNESSSTTVHVKFYKSFFGFRIDQCADANLINLHKLSKPTSQATKVDVKL